MKKRLILFMIGVVLLLSSLPISTKMVMELIHKKRMNERYEIAKVPTPDSTYNFHNHVIAINETITTTETYRDPWDDQIILADLSLQLDEEQLDVLNNHPIRVGEIGLNRYYGEVAYFILNDKKNGKTKFVILLKKTRELPKEMSNGDIVGMVPEEKLNYTLYAIDGKGNIDKDSFRFTERDALQTELLNSSGVVPYPIGYYTDAWMTYPSIFFPFIFPFFTLLIGLILSIVYIPIKRQSL